VLNENEVAGGSADIGTWAKWAGGASNATIAPALALRRVVEEISSWFGSAAIALLDLLLGRIASRRLFAVGRPDWRWVP